MGQLIDGKMGEGLVRPRQTQRLPAAEAVFRNLVAPEDVELGRYHLYVSYTPRARGRIAR